MIPLMVTTAEERLKLRGRWLVVGGAAAAVAVGTAALLWKVASH
jgi:hypothetical protein